jgi:hypothetical protein
MRAWQWKTAYFDCALASEGGLHSQIAISGPPAGRHNVAGSKRTAQPATALSPALGDNRRGAPLNQEPIERQAEAVLAAVAAMVALA